MRKLNTNLISEYVFKFKDEFTSMPIGRFRSDGNKSGEVFREEYLIPLLEQYDKIIIDLTGIIGITESFIDEAFLGLVKKLDEIVPYSGMDLQSAQWKFIKEDIVFRWDESPEDATRIQDMIEEYICSRE